MCPVQQRRIWREIIIWNISVETKVELDFIKILDKISIFFIQNVKSGLKWMSRSMKLDPNIPEFQYKSESHGI